MRKEPPFAGAVPLAYAEGDIADGERYVARCYFLNSETADQALERARRDVEAQGLLVVECGFAWEQSQR
jgi:hypothetical protein